MDSDEYYTLSQVSQDEYKEKGSKFIAYAFPIDTEADIKKSLESVKDKHHDARHHCYAYRLGRNGENCRANDDGEPNHTAGDPILGQIKSFEVTNCLVVVVRYFGGTKLGVSGLINAYKTAAELALRSNKKVKRFESEVFEIRYKYEETNFIQKTVQDLDMAIIDQEFELECKMKLRCRKKHLNQARQLLKNNLIN